MSKELALIWGNLKQFGYFSPYIYLKSAGHKGLGVFAKTDIQQGVIIEYCHSFVLNNANKDIQDNKLNQYIYTFDSSKRGIVPLGFGMAYNSADSKEEANAEYSTFEQQNLIIYKAKKNIDKDTEILLWWGEDYYNYWCKNK